jgi:hypothetical protein
MTIYNQHVIAYRCKCRMDAALALILADDERECEMLYIDVLNAEVEQTVEEGV